MENEKRLIDANAVPKLFEKKYEETEQRILDGETYLDTLAEGFTEADDVILSMPTVDAVEVEKYNRLVEAYHELRENFVDFACSGIPNVAPYCLNRCDGCCDAYDWCRQSDLCQGFNPAEVILDGERKDNA